MKYFQAALKISTGKSISSGNKRVALTGDNASPIEINMR